MPRSHQDMRKQLLTIERDSAKFGERGRVLGVSKFSLHSYIECFPPTLGVGNVNNFTFSIRKTGTLITVCFTENARILLEYELAEVFFFFNLEMNSML